MTIGIYKLTNTLNGKVYVGQSRNIEKRFRQYINKQCKTQTKLYHALLKYGVEAFRFEVLQVVNNATHLDSYEDLYIKYYRSSTEGYNVMHKSSGRGSQADSTRAKIGAGNRGKPKSEEHKAKLAAAIRGRTHSDETRTKLSSLRKGKQQTAEHRANRAASMIGYKPSDETCAKISAANKGKLRGPMSEEHKAKISKGRRHNAQNQ